MATRVKWLLLILLIIVLVAVPVLSNTSCTPGEQLYYLVRSVICGVEIFADGNYQGITEQLPGWFSCVFLGPITGGEHEFDFVIPSSVVAAAASAASGKLMTASEVPEITASYKGPLVDGGRYEVKLSAESGGVAMQNVNETYEQTIVLEVSSAPFEPPPATRTLPASVDEGADFNVTITASGCGMCGQVVETLPTGFSYVSCDSTDIYVTQGGNTISFTFMGDSVAFDYTVTASTTEGTYSFSGIVKDEYKVEYPIGGDENIAVGFAPWAYDADGDGAISKSEALTSVTDYFAGDITKAQALEVIALYFTS